MVLPQVRRSRPAGRDRPQRLGRPFGLPADRLREPGVRVQREVDVDQSVRRVQPAHPLGRPPPQLLPGAQGGGGVLRQLAPHRAQLVGLRQLPQIADPGQDVRDRVLGVGWRHQVREQDLTLHQLGQQPVRLVGGDLGVAGGDPLPQQAPGQRPVGVFEDVPHHGAQPQRDLLRGRPALGPAQRLVGQHQPVAARVGQVVAGDPQPAEHPGLLFQAPDQAGEPFRAGAHRLPVPLAPAHGGFGREAGGGHAGHQPERRGAVGHPQPVAGDRAGRAPQLLGADLLARLHLVQDPAERGAGDLDRLAQQRVARGRAQPFQIRRGAGLGPAPGRSDRRPQQGDVGARESRRGGIPRHGRTTVGGRHFWHGWHGGSVLSVRGWWHAGGSACLRLPGSAAGRAGPPGPGGAAARGTPTRDPSDGDPWGQSQQRELRVDSQENGHESSSEVVAAATRSCAVSWTSRTSSSKALFMANLHWNPCPGRPPSGRRHRHRPDRGRGRLRPLGCSPPALVPADT